MPSSAARQPKPTSPIFATLTRGFDEQGASAARQRTRTAGGAQPYVPSHDAVDCPIFDQLAGRRLARRRSNFVLPD